MAEVMTPGVFQLSDIYPPITITPKCLSFSSPSTLAPKNDDDNNVSRGSFGLDVAFLVGKTTLDNIPPAGENASTIICLNKDDNVSSPTTTNSSRTSSPGSMSTSSSDSGEKKNIRTKYTSQQLITLEKVFIENPYLDTDEVEKLAGEIGVTEGKIRIWFQNKRARWRRRAQNNTQQHLQPAMPPSTPVYFSMPPYAYMNMPPSIYTSMPSAQNSIQQQTLRPTVVPSTSGYSAMPTSNYRTIPPYLSMPSVLYPSMSSTHDRLPIPKKSTPTHPRPIEPHHSNDDTPTTDNSTKCSSPSSSPGSTSCGTIRSLSRMQSPQSSGSPQQSLLQSSGEAKTYLSSPSSAPIADTIPRQIMASFYNPIPQYSPYYPHIYSQFPLYC